MVQLIVAIEREAKNLMLTIRKFKKMKKKDLREEDEDEENENGRSKAEDEEEERISRHKVSTSLDKIGCLEKEIKQICSRITNLNQCVNVDSDEDDM